jgi:hypothetical protein
MNSNRTWRPTIKSAFAVAAVASLIAFVGCEGANAATIVNGDFEGGISSTTPGGSTVPVGWTANQSWGETGFNGVVPGQGVNGSAGLSIGIISPRRLPSRKRSWILGGRFTISTFLEEGGGRVILLTSS